MHYIHIYVYINIMHICILYYALIGMYYVCM